MDESLPGRSRASWFACPTSCLFSLPTPPKSLRDEGRTAKPKFTRRPVRRRGIEVGRFIEGGLARHPLGGLKDSACPPSVWRVHPV